MFLNNELSKAIFQKAFIVLALVFISAYTFHHFKFTQALYSTHLSQVFLYYQDPLIPLNNISKEAQVL